MQACFLAVWLKTEPFQNSEYPKLDKFQQTSLEYFQLNSGKDGSVYILKRGKTPIGLEGTMRIIEIKSKGLITKKMSHDNQFGIKRASI